MIIESECKLFCVKIDVSGQAEELFRAIGYIDDALILRSDRKKKKKNWFAIYGGVMVSAACLALLIGTNYMMNRPITDGPQPSITSQPSQSGDGNGPDYYDSSATPIPEDYWTEQESPKDYGMMPEVESVKWKNARGKERK